MRGAYPLRPGLPTSCNVVVTAISVEVGMHDGCKILILWMIGLVRKLSTLILLAANLLTGPRAT